ncbi:glycosyltransferase family 4 protein [Gaiella occulta]|nr:glycosyltransferase family 4 protein [Gaiella occulta]
MGGIASATRDQARSLARRGHRVHVLAPAWEAAGSFDDEGVLVHRLRSPGWQLPGASRLIGQSLDRLGWSRAAARAVSRLHRLERLDLVEAPEFAAEGLLAARRAAPPVVVRLHTPLALVRRLNGTPLRRDCRLTVHWERAALQAAAAVSAPSAAIAHACAEAGYGPAAAAARIIPYGVDTSLFCPDGGVAACAATAAGPLVLFPGRLEARKGVGDFASALPAIAAQVPEARFAFVGADTQTAPGGGSWQQQLIAHARAAGIEGRVQFAGFLPREQLPSWYRAASTVVAPSPFENLALVFLEALACGRPLVGCSSGAFPEAVSDGSEGRTVAPCSPQALAGAVVDLLRDPAAAAAMGRRGRQLALRRFSLERVAALTEEFYGEVIATWRSR